MDATQLDDFGDVGVSCTEKQSGHFLTKVIEGKKKGVYFKEVNFHFQSQI